MQKNYPVLFNQNDYGGVYLGNSTTETIAAGGCFDSSLAMKSNFYGHTIDPVGLNEIFKQKNIYIDTDLLPDNALAQVYPDVKYLKTIDYEPIPTDLANIMSLLSDPAITLTLRINFKNGNLHFVEAVNCDGLTLHIANPISGEIEDFRKRYGNPVSAYLHVLVYTGPVPKVEQSASSNQSALTLRFNQAITKSRNFDDVATELEFTPDQIVSTDGGKLAVAKIEEYKKTIATLQEQLKAMPIATLSTAPTTLPVTLSTSQPEAPKEVAKLPKPSPTLYDGTNPVSSSQPSKATTLSKGAISASIQSGSVSFLEFFKAFLSMLFK